MPTSYIDLIELRERLDPEVLRQVMYWFAAIALVGWLLTHEVEGLTPTA